MEQNATLQAQILRAQYRAVKAETERLWYRIHRDRISRKRKERYRTDALYRAKIRARHSRKTFLPAEQDSLTMKGGRN